MKFIQIFKTGLFFAVLTALLILLGYFLSGVTGALVFFGISLMMNLGMYWFSSTIALKMSGAEEVPEGELVTLREDMIELSQKMQIPIPKLYISHELQPNAFATGRNPSNSAVCFTQGILQVLNREELRSVMAHELAHIKNRDVLLSTIASVFAGAISSFAQIGMFFGGDEERNPIVDLLVILLAPITATIIQLAISRSREYLADATAAKFTGEPESLVSALEKIHNYSVQVPMNVNPALSSLYISNPFSGGALMSLFSTHPLLEKRTKRLLSIPA